jgi:hypothetical protein
MNNMKNLRTGIGGAILTLAFIFGISAAAGTTTQAQYRSDRNVQRRDRDRDNDNNRTQNRDWRRDRNQSQNRRYNRQDRIYSNNGVYNNGGYNNGVYNNGVYNNGVYNNGGYNNGGYNNGGYGNGNQVALSQGYQYGLNTGASDAQRGQSFSPQRSHYYQQASSQAFRNGFVQGYNAGYRQYAGYGNGSYGQGNTRSILGSIFGRP